MSESYWNKKPNVQTTKVFSPHMSEGQQLLTVNKDLGIPLISAINNQNIHLVSSTQSLSKQLEKLSKLSQSLMVENQRLRSHYYQRNEDLKNLVSTIRINIGEQVNDRQHEIHLIREVNCKIFKNIQNQTRAIQDYQQRINQLTRRFQLLKQNNIELQVKVLHLQEVRAQSHLNAVHVGKEQKKLEKITQSEEKLLKQTSQLVLKINRLQKINLGGIRDNNNNNYENLNDKKMYKEQIINTLKSLGQLKMEKNELSQFLRKCEKNLQTTKLKLIQMKETVERRTIEKQKNQQKLKKAQKTKQIKIQIGSETNKIMESLKQKVYRAEGVKNNLLEQIEKRKKNFDQMKGSHLAQKQNIKNECNKSIYQMKMKINEAQGEATLKKSALKLELKEEQKYLQSLKQQYRQLQKDAKDYGQMYRKFRGPAQEVQKTIMQYKLLKNRQPLQGLHIPGNIDC